MLEIITKARQRLNRKPLKRDMVALGCTQINYAIAQYADGSPTKIIINPFGKNRREIQITDISSNYSNISFETLAKLLVFKSLGGTEEEFWQLVKYANIIKKGDDAINLPLSVRIVRVYDPRHENDPGRKGLIELYLEGDNQPDVEHYHTRFHHLFHHPLAPDGITLDHVASGMFAEIDPSLVERAETTYQCVHR